MRIPELQATVGSMDHLKVAINAGASSVYLSGKNYGARKFAENFTLDEIQEAVNTAHLHNVKVYITVNTLIKEGELENVMNYLAKLFDWSGCGTNPGFWIDRANQRIPSKPECSCINTAHM